MSKNKIIAAIVLVIVAISFGTIYLVRTNKSDNSNQVTEVGVIAVETTNVTKGDIGKVRDFTSSVKDMTGTLVLNVVEEDLNMFKSGQNYDVEVILNEGKKAGKATVANISTTKDVTTNLFPVTLNIITEEGIILPGSFARVRVPYNKKSESIAVGKNTVIKEGDKAFVYTVKDSIATKVEITTGIENNNEIEVLTGLNEGDVIVSKGKEFVKDGEKVNVVGGAIDENN